ncbi:hypothetical protein HW132_10095 [Brasilonema sp. CT11]|nr:hypothetical protein [Brasilonema sp. CT11]
MNGFKKDRAQKKESNFSKPKNPESYTQSLYLTLLLFNLISSLMTEPLTAAVIVSLFFSEAIKEGGKALTKGATDTFAHLVNTIREKFKAEGTEGLLKRAESEPTQKNKEKVQDELQAQMDADKAFAQKLKELVQLLQAQDEKIRQVVLSEIELTGDLKAKDISQKATRDGSVEQEMVKGVKATNIDLGNLNQEA